MIDALFGSKTRVKLLYLFLSHPDEAFYVREITRVIDEQINSVRRELANMISVGVVLSSSSDNKLYYRVNRDYEYFTQLHSIFSNNKETTKPSVEVSHSSDSVLNSILLKVAGSKLIVTAGKLVEGSISDVDLLIAGSVSASKMQPVIDSIERLKGCEINYALLSFEDFYYRLSVRDSFIINIINAKHIIIKDTEKVLG